MAENVIRRGLLPLGFAMAGLLSGCGGSGPVRMPPVAGVGGYQGGGGISCVPFARARTGIELRGDAWEWWDAALGRYQRGRHPAVGHVLVMGRTRRLPQGHLSVVRRQVAPREIRVDHANWAEAGGQGRGRIAEDQPVIDVSSGNDWSAVRVWYPPIRDYGHTVFAAHGFISPRLAAG
jgi:hypothetical protein